MKLNNTRSLFSDGAKTSLSSFQWRPTNSFEPVLSKLFSPFGTT